MARTISPAGFPLTPATFPLPFPMLDQVMAAFERQDYPTAAQLLRELVKQSPNDPWVKLYLGRLQEVSGKLKVAEEIYRQLLQTSTHPKLVLQARQGLQRLGATGVDRPQPKPVNKNSVLQKPIDFTQNLGFLVLEAINSQSRLELGQRFAQILHTDAYTARGILPGRGWRLYRVGEISELDTFGQELRQADIPAFWAAIAEIQAIQVFQVNYVRSLHPTVEVVCQNQTNQTGVLTFDPTEVTQRVEGLLPLFSQVVDLGYRDQLEWKEHVEDYAHFYDLHLPKRRAILRIHDGKYNFRQGVTATSQRDTTRQRWNELIALLSQHLPQTTIWSDFAPFVETVSDFADSLHRLKSHIYLPRSSDRYVDPAFHLYSCLVFLKSRHLDT